MNSGDHPRRGNRAWRLVGVCLAMVATGLLTGSCFLPAMGARAVLVPHRRSPAPAPSLAHEDVVFQGDGITLRGWRFPAAGPRRGLLVYLHGHQDDRRGGVGIAQRFTPRGLDVLAYDSRAHGQSGGEACTFGVHEKKDLMRALDRGPEGPVVLLGFSLGAAVALQAAADDPRISLVVAIEAFSDLRTVVSERAPFFFTRRQIEEALRRAEVDGQFCVDDASPLKAAPRIRSPVLLVHGAADRDTPPEHSQRIFASLSGTKELILLPGASHNDPLDEATWRRIEDAVDRALERG